MKHKPETRREKRVAGATERSAAGLLAASCILAIGAASPLPTQPQQPAPSQAPPPPASETRTLDETRQTMGRWIETQQIISKERIEWQQGKEIVTARIDLIKSEIATLEEKIQQAESSVAEADKKRDEVVAESDALKAVVTQLTDAVTRLEIEIRRLYKNLPEPLQTKLQPLHVRIPEDAATTRVTAAERFQNVIGILNELNKANNEITVNYEIHNLAGGKPSEVQAIYIGLGQAYYVSAGGEAGIGRPTSTGEGWLWEPSAAIARDVLMTLEIIQGKHTPAFVGLPVKMQ